MQSNMATMASSSRASHAMGRTVGMDIIPHTDRFSQMALAYPHYFEWLRRQDQKAGIEDVVGSHRSVSCEALEVDRPYLSSGRRQFDGPHRSQDVNAARFGNQSDSDGVWEPDLGGFQRTDETH